MGYTIGDAFTLAEQLNVSFESGTPTQFAQDHLQIGPGPTPVPEPTTLSLLGIGAAALTTRRFRRKG